MCLTTQASAAHRDSAAHSVSTASDRFPGKEISGIDQRGRKVLGWVEGFGLQHGIEPIEVVEN